MKSGETVNHRGSTLLKEEENQEVFQLIGNRCQVRIIISIHLLIAYVECYTRFTIDGFFILH